MLYYSFPSFYYMVPLIIGIVLAVTQAHKRYRGKMHGLVLFLLLVWTFVLVCVLIQNPAAATSKWLLIPGAVYLILIIAVSLTDGKIERLDEQKRLQHEKKTPLQSVVSNAPKLLWWQQVLCVSASATLSDVKNRYRELSKRFHPNSNGPEANAAKFRKVHEAYQAAQQYFGAGVSS